jgi:hypothetical protein
MRDDLLDAQASVDWAVSQIPILQQRIATWISNQPCSFIEEKDASASTKSLKLRVDYIPPIISAEAGIIAHAIRSSLDVLASSLAKRNDHVSVRDVYFPICSCVMDLMDPLGCMEKVKRLSKAERQIIESLKPYPEGNPLLCALHEVDITRKHTELLRVSISLENVEMDGGYIYPTGAGTIEAFPKGIRFIENETVLLTVGEASTFGKVSVRLGISFDKIKVIKNKPVVATLHEFASLATAIIKLFDTP